MIVSARKMVLQFKGMDTGKVLRSCPGCIEDAAKILSEKLGE